MAEEKTVGIRDVMKYFEETSTSKFAAEWKELSLEDKLWLKQAVAEIMTTEE